MVDHRPR